MQETLLYYALTDEMKTPILAILHQLDVYTKELTKDDLSQQMGYLLELPGYSKKEETSTKNLSEPFLFFAHFTEEQLDIVLEVFKQAGVPYIPYKAMLTNDNVVYTFEEVYINVENEYKHLTGNGQEQKLN